MSRPWMRALSLIAGLGVGAVFMLYPYALGTTMTPVLHSALPLLFLGVSAAIVHGVGFRPDNRWLRTFFSPAVAWPLMAVGIGLVAIG